MAPAQNLEVATPQPPGLTPLPMPAASPRLNADKMVRQSTENYSLLVRLLALILNSGSQVILRNNIIKSRELHHYNAHLTIQGDFYTLLTYPCVSTSFVWVWSSV